LAPGRGRVASARRRSALARVNSEARRRSTEGAGACVSRRLLREALSGWTTRTLAADEAPTLRSRRRWADRLRGGRGTVPLTRPSWVRDRPRYQDGSLRWAIR